MKHLKLDIREKNYLVAPKLADAVSMIKEMTGEHPIDMFGPDYQNMLDEMEYDAEQRQGEED